MSDDLEGLAPDAADRPMLCRSYTHAHRYPLVVGNIQGLKLPIPWTLTQLVTVSVSFGVLVLTRGLWAQLGLGPIGNGLLLLIVPCVLGRFARQARIEGRAPWRFALGAARYLNTGGREVQYGRPVRGRARARVVHARIPTRAGGQR